MISSESIKFTHVKEFNRKEFSQVNQNLVYKWHLDSADFNMLHFDIKNDYAQWNITLIKVTRLITMKCEDSD